MTYMFIRKKNKQTNIPAIKYRTSIDKRIIIINIEQSKLNLHLNGLKADSYLSFTILAFEQATLLCLSYKNSTGLTTKSMSAIHVDNVCGTNSS